MLMLALKSTARLKFFLEICKSPNRDYILNSCHYVSCVNTRESRSS